MKNYWMERIIQRRILCLTLPTNFSSIPKLKSCFPEIIFGPRMFNDKPLVKSVIMIIRKQIKID